MKKRETSRWIDKRKDSQGRTLCLVPTCNEIAKKYKNGNYRNYCKNHNYGDMQEFTSWPVLRLKAFKRDNYSCVKCGDNRKDVSVIIKSKRSINIQEYIEGKDTKLKYKIHEMEQMVNNLFGDHIIPIALGGEEFDINNVQTFCLKCNKIKTSQDAKDIAKQRRIEKNNNYKNT